jgi:integrase
MAKRKIKNLFRNHRGKWCVDITVKNRRIIRVIGDDRREAENVLAVIKADLLRGKLGMGRPAAVVPFKVFAQKFLDTYAIKKRSYARDQGAYDCHLKKHFGEIPIREIKLERIEQYIAARRTEISRRKKVASGATINRELALLRTMLNKAVEWEYLDASPVNWKRVKKLPENSRERYLTPEERTRLFMALVTAPPVLRAFVVLAINTGMRKGEILGLKWANVNLDDGQICLERAQRKNGKVLRVPVNQAVREVLSSLPHASEYVLCDPQTGERYKSLRRSFTTACRRAKKDPDDKDDLGITDLRIHDLRHTFGTMLNARGVDLPTISSLLGHSSITMTSKYITPVSEIQRRAVDSLMDEPEEKRKKSESPAGEIPDEDGKRVYIQ